MTEEAKTLLKKMANEYDRSGKNCFDSMLYTDYSNTVLRELENNGCITMKNDVAGTIQLTNDGYDKSIG